ncbi:MAG: ribosome small subunit-dependent GTPase A [Thermoanaerobaculales bacterium]
MELVEGTVIAMHGPLVRVQVGDRTLVVASRRRLNWEGGTPEAARLVVGDGVSVEMRGEDGVVVSVYARRNSLLRKAPGAERAQILAANVDQALLVFATREPDPKPRLLDRFLVACHLAGIEAVITINKVDQGCDEVEKWLGGYEDLGFRVLRVSARTGWGLCTVKRLLVDRTTLFCGPSGAGKSSLLNSVYPGFRLKVGTLSQSTGKGRHTTTSAELMPLPYGGFVVDTPGLREFGLWAPTRRELESAFPEIARRAGECRFPDCSHLHEPDCTVQEGVEAGVIDAGRYASFMKILEETIDGKN